MKNVSFRCESLEMSMMSSCPSWFPTRRTPSLCSPCTETWPASLSPTKESLVRSFSSDLLGALSFFYVVCDMLCCTCVAVPLPPAGELRISEVTHSSMRLMWDAAPGMVRKYIITYKREDGELKEVMLSEHFWPFERTQMYQQFKKARMNFPGWCVNADGCVWLTGRGQWWHHHPGSYQPEVADGVRCRRHTHVRRGSGASDARQRNNWWAYHLCLR